MGQKPLDFVAPLSVFSPHPGCYQHMKNVFNFIHFWPYLSHTQARQQLGFNLSLLYHLSSRFKIDHALLVICSQGVCNSLPEQNLIKEEQATPWEVVCSQLNPRSLYRSISQLWFHLTSTSQGSSHPYLGSQRGKAGNYGPIFKRFLCAVYLFP